MTFSVVAGLLYEPAYAKSIRRMNRTRSTAAGVEVPVAEAMAGEPKGRGAAAAAKSRHARNLPVKPAATQDTNADQANMKSLAPQDVGQPKDLLPQQQHTSESAPDAEANIADKLQPENAAAAAQLSKSTLPKASCRTRRLPAQPKPNRKGKSAKAPAPTAETASAEHAVHAEPNIEPSSKPVSTTLASVAQILAASRQKRALPASTTAEAADVEHIDLADDFADESGDSDFEPGNNSDPEISDVEVIDLSQEGALDVVQQPNGLLSIRSPEQAAAAVAAVAEDSGMDDDEEEFQQLTGKGKRKQPAKGAAAEKGSMLATN